jgi:anti-anti-sigma factor
MSISVKTNGSVASIILVGGIDYATQDDFKIANQKALAMKGVSQIHVDFARATFLDSSGIRALLILQRDAQSRDKSVYLINCNEYILDIFEIGGFDQIFNLM